MHQYLRSARAGSSTWMGTSTMGQAGAYLRVPLKCCLLLLTCSSSEGKYAHLLQSIGMTG